MKECKRGIISFGEFYEIDVKIKRHKIKIKRRKIGGNKTMEDTMMVSTKVKYCDACQKDVEASTSGPISGPEAGPTCGPTSGPKPDHT